MHTTKRLDKKGKSARDIFKKVILVALDKGHCTSKQRKLYL